MYASMYLPLPQRQRYIVGEKISKFERESSSNSGTDSNINRRYKNNWVRRMTAAKIVDRRMNELRQEIGML